MEKRVRFDKEAFLATPPIATVNHGLPTDLYILECGNFIKVGIASNVAHRLKSIQAMNPFPVTVAKTYGFNHRTAAKLAEAAVHAALSDYHQSGEWFAAPVSVAVEAIHLVRIHLKTLLAIHGRHDRGLPHYHDAF